MSNLLNELEIIEGDESYLVTLYDASAHTKIGTLNDLTTTNKSNVVSAINEINADINAEITNRENAISALQTDINDEVTARKNYIVYNPSGLDSSVTTNIGLKAGNTYNVTENTTINAQLVVPKGAIINIANGITLTINGEIVAGAYQIFSGSGTLVVDKKQQKFGYPEWFGAMVNNSSYDCSIEINKVLQIFGECRLSKAIYYISNTVALNNTDMKLKGTGYNDIFTDRDSTIIDTRDTGTSILIGATTEPPAINDFPIGITISGIIVDRVGTPKEGSIGIETRWNLHGIIKYVKVKNSEICYLLNHNIYAKFYDNIAIQYFTNIEKWAIKCSAGVTTGVVGNNASLYIKDFSCVGSLDVAHYNGGLYIEDAPADTFIDGFETSGYQNGIIIEDKTRNLNSSNDIHISKAILDGIALYGIYLHGLSDTGSVSIENCYVAPNNTTNTYAYCVHNCGCGISFVNNQAILNVASNQSIGFYINASNSISLKGNIIVDSYRPYVIDNALSITIDDVVKMFKTGGETVISLSGTSEGIIFRGIVNGELSAYNYLMKSQSNLPCELNVSAINKTIISHLANDGTNDYDTVGEHTNILITGVLTI